MTTKKKILISCIAGVLVVALGVVGVLAATSQSINLTASVGFSAQSVVARVTVTAQSKTGEAAAVAKTTNPADGIINFAAGETDGGTVLTKAVTIEDHTFNKDDVLTYTIVIKNLSATKGISATIPQTAAVPNLTINYDYKLGDSAGEGNEATPEANVLTIGNSTTGTDVLTIVITVSVSDPSFNVGNSELNFSATLAAV